MSDCSKPEHGPWDYSQVKSVIIQDGVSSIGNFAFSGCQNLTYIPISSAVNSIGRYAVGSTTDFKTIQGISGHSDVFTLMNRYAHPRKDKVIELSNEIATILTQNAENQQTPSCLINQGIEHSQKS